MKDANFKIIKGIGKITNKSLKYWTSSLALNWNNNIPFNLSGDSKLELCLSWAYLNAKIVSSGYPDDEEKSISLKTCTRLFHNNT